jgi:RNA polymerase sigma-70 factor (ECF subfamily)
MAKSGHRSQATDQVLCELFEAYQDGELEAFDRLYSALESELRSFFRARCHDTQRVDDLLQDTFLQIHRSRSAYLRGRPLRPWVYAIAKRVFHMHLRTIRRRESPEAERLQDGIEPAGPWHEERTVTRLAIADALGQVSVDRRRAFLLHHWRGFSFREIAVKLRIQPGAAKIRSSRAAGQLRDLLQSGGSSRE